VAPEKGKAQAFTHLDRADAFPVDLETSAAKIEDFDAAVKAFAAAG
jgi:protease I